MAELKLKYLPGLNSLRFFAAFFVVISHAGISLDKLGIQPASGLAFLNRGGDAVDFFFTLSGFLITYLLITEIHQTGTVSIKQFYLRRVFRIWPLYFFVVCIGFFLLGYVYPKMYHQLFFSFSIPQGLLLFIFFMPNYAAKNYTVGLLNPLWSIGVEEQFYLFWAPMVKLFKKYLLPMILLFIAASLTFYAVVYYRIFPIATNWEVFFLTQKFYSMAIGSLFGYILYHHAGLYNNSILANKKFQLLVLAVILWHFLFHNVAETGLWFKVLFSFLYGLLILNVSVVTEKLLNMEQPVLTYLGTISYGIYMYHMLVDYCLRLMVPKLSFLHLPKILMVPLYYILMVAATIGVAALSFRYFERYFLQLKDRLHNNKILKGDYAGSAN
ncbi:MAG: acyltransferase [Chitinophagaceae bacterium]|nr:acyltransferase [Chitinophagaceae bacterium]